MFSLLNLEVNHQLQAGVVVVSVGHAKEENLAHNVKADQPDDGFREDEGEGELQDKARDIPDIRKKSNKEVKN